MATVIDSLLVTLGLDSSKFEAGTKRVDKSLGGITASATKFLAVIGGSYAIKRFVEDQVAASATLDRLSRNLDEGVSKISAWSNAAELAGGSASGLQGTLDMLSRAQTDLQLTGQSSLIPYFSALGLSIADVHGRAKPTTQLLVDMADRFSKMDRVTANNMGRSMGIDQGTMNLLLKGRTEVELLVKRQREQNAVTKVQAEQATRLQAAMIGSRQSFEAFGRELLSKATPALEKVFAVLSDLGEWARNNREFVEAMLTVIAVGLGLIGAALIPINLTAIALLGLAAALALVWQDYQTFTRGGDALGPWAKWLPGIKAAGEGIKWIAGLLSDVIYRAIAAGDLAAAVFSGDLSRAKFALGELMAGRNAAGGAPLPPSLDAAPAAGGNVPAAGNERDRFIAEAASRLGVPTSVVDAHLRTETGRHGLSTIGQYNYGNIKAGKSWDGKTSGQNVLEYDANGNPTREKASFRAYGTPEEAAVDYARLIGTRYPGASGATSAEEYAKALKSGGYATDPEYVSKMARIGRGIPGAAQAAAGAGARPSYGRASSTSTTTIGEIKVYTAATDAAGIAKDMSNEMDFLFNSQGDSGLN